MSAEQIVTLLIALYGAIIGTILGIRELARDSRSLAIFLEYVAWVERAQVTIVNTGHRPITIAEVSVEVNDPASGHPLEYRRSDLFDVDPDPLPATLSDADHITLPISGLVSEPLLASRLKADVVVTDIEGHRFTKHRIRTYDAKWGYYSDKM